MELRIYISVKYDNVRCKSTETFPYRIHYVIDEENQIVIVVGLFHTARNPEIWKKSKNTD